MSFTASHTRRGFLGAVAVLALAVLTTSAQTASAVVVLNIDKTYVVPAGGTVNVSVDLTNDASLTAFAFGIALSFDTSVFTMSNVQPGSLLGAAFTANFASTFSNGTGILTASSFDFTGQTFTPGSGALLTFDLTNTGATPLTSPINLLATSGNTTTAIEDLNGPIALTTPPTNANNEAVDGLVTITAIPEPSQFAMAGLLVGLGGLRHVWSRRRARAAA
ncbi:MAG: cohesin domain-containing protein [Isosphaeraceae bacterium]